MSEEDPFSGTKAAIEKFVAVHEEVLKAVLAQKDAEIERLRAEVKQLQPNADIQRLLISAADALQLYANYPIGMVMSVTLRERAREILPQLRSCADAGS